MFKIGDKVWIFDAQHRVYDGNGLSGGKIIYAGYFVQEVIVGETSRSWLVGYFKTKYPKSTCAGLYTDEQKADAIWVECHGWKVALLVDQCRDVGKLRKIAEIVGYREENEKGK